jgi:pimeloyl-ACP methyl ester carboxylesterase
VSSIVTDHGVVHYEVAGRGKPIILLHGWIGSWDHWVDTMICLESRFRGYALDFWGFGDSTKKLDSFHINDFVAMVDQFMERLGIDTAPIIGHSMGGTVALSLALAKPDRAKQVIVVGSPIVGNSLNPFLQLAGHPQVAALLWRFPSVFRLFLRLYAPFVANASQRWYKRVVRDISATTEVSFFSSIRSLRHTDLRPRLPEIKVPTLGIYGLGDVIVSPYQSKLISQHVKRSHVAMMAGSGHFPMLDEPELFNQHLLDFLYQDSD